MRYILFLFVSLLLFSACGNSTNSEAETTVQNAEPMLPSFPLEKLEYLWQYCDYIDYIFYELPISMSLDTKAAIQYSLSHVAQTTPPAMPQCKPVGRVFYQVDGENYAEADLYFSQGCTYFVFMEDQKPTYANYMTDEGIQYMNNNLAQVQNKIQ